MEKIYKCRRCGADIEPDKYPYCIECLALLRLWLSDIDYKVSTAERHGMDDYVGYEESDHRPPRPIRFRHIHKNPDNSVWG